MNRYIDDNIELKNQMTILWAKEMMQELCFSILLSA